MIAFSYWINIRWPKFKFAAPYWYLFFYTCISYVGTYKIHHYIKIYYLQIRTLKCQIWFTYKFSMLSNITNTTYRAHQEYNCVNDDDHQYRRNGLFTRLSNYYFFLVYWCSAANRSVTFLSQYYMSIFLVCNVSGMLVFHLFLCFYYQHLFLIGRLLFLC